jgi:hypothetical protein
VGTWMCPGRLSEISTAAVNNCPREASGAPALTLSSYGSLETVTGK